MSSDTDRYEDAAKRLLIKLREFDVAAIDEAVGNDEERIKQEVVAEWLRQEFGK